MLIIDVWHLLPIVKYLPRHQFNFSTVLVFLIWNSVYFASDIILSSTERERESLCIEICFVVSFTYSVQQAALTGFACNF
jgi:hypothetical protein